jgi:flagellin-like hook-associated protein FlgL
LDSQAGFTSGETFSYGYNWDWTQDSDSALLTGRYLAGRYTVNSSDSLQTLINKVNDGTQSRVGIQLVSASLNSAVINGGTVAVCIGDEAYYWGESEVAEGGSFYTSAYQYSNTTSAIQIGPSGIYATGALRSLLLGAADVTVTSTLLGSASATAGAEALLNQIRANLLGNQILSSVAYDPAVFNAAYLTVAGLTTTNYPIGLSAFGTGIFHDGAGNYTLSATLANSLGFTQQITFDISSLATFSAANNRDFVGGDASAYFTALGIPGLVSGLGTTGDYQTGIYVSGSMWTNSATLAATMNASEIIIRVSGGTTRNAYAASFDIIEYLSAKGIQSGLTAYFTGTFDYDAQSAIWYSTTTGDWTHNYAVGSALGMTMLSLTLSANSLHSTPSRDPNVVLTSKDWLSAQTGFSGTYPVSPGTYNLDLWIQTGAGGTYWTTSAAVAGKFNGLGGSQPAGGSMYRVSVALDGTETNLDDVYAKFDSIYQAMVLPSAVALSNEVYRIGDSWGDIQNKFNDAIGATAGPTKSREIAFLGDTWTDMAVKLTAKIPGYVNMQVTDFTPRDINAIAAAEFTAALTAASLATEIRTRAINLSDLPSSIFSAANMTSSEVDGATETRDGIISTGKTAYQVANSASNQSYFTARALASAINANSSSQFWAMVQPFDSNGLVADMLYVFTKQGGNFNDLLACDVGASDSASRSGLNSISFENTESSERNQSGTTFTLGGQHWGTMKPIQTQSNLGNEVWNVTLNGRDVGSQRDLWIANSGEITTPNLSHGIINGMDRYSFVEIQNAEDGPWVGAEVRTQSAAQAALDAITESITKKDKIRADLGALQNRLENTMTNLTVQAENLQASESRISDVDVATEMTEFTRNNVLSQAATSMLAQANSLSQLALSLIR